MAGWDVTINVATSIELLPLDTVEGKWYGRVNNAAGATIREEWTSTMASAFFWDGLVGGQTYTATFYRTNSTTSNSQTSIQSNPVIRTFTLATDTPPEPPDTTPPTVVFSSPATGSTMSGTIIWVVTVSDDFDTIANIDASVTHGNSGGALVNDRGELVGIVSQQFTTAQPREILGIPVYFQDPVAAGNMAVSPDHILRFLRERGIT